MLTFCQAKDELLPAGYELPLIRQVSLRILRELYGRTINLKFESLKMSVTEMYQIFVFQVSGR